MNAPAENSDSAKNDLEDALLDIWRCATVLGALGAYATSTRVNEPPGSPVAAFHVAPPSFE